MSSSSKLAGLVAAELKGILAQGGTLSAATVQEALERAATTLMLAAPDRWASLYLNHALGEVEEEGEEPALYTYLEDETHGDHLLLLPGDVAALRVALLLGSHKQRNIKQR